MIILEGHVAKVGGMSKTGKMMECLVAWNSRPVEGQEKQTVFLPVWFYVNTKNSHIDKGDWVLVKGKVLQREKEKGGHRTYILGRLFVIGKKVAKQDIDLPPLPEDELPF